MQTSSRLVIVSNKLPVTVKRADDGTLEYEPSAGGLATAMSSLDVKDKVWVGWPYIASDNLTDDEKQEIKEKLVEFSCVPVFLSEQQVALFYEGYSNDTLWPLFHYFQSYTHYEDDYWDSYQEVNKLYADAVHEVSAEDASIWVHDYHLMMLPSLIREQLPQSSIGFFLHIPFPSFEIYRLLPQRKELLHGLLGADLIGFHVYDYARHFLSSCLRLIGISNHRGMLEYGGRIVQTDAYPIGIDYNKFQRTIGDGETKKAIKTLKENYSNQKVIISVDRLDYSKGIPERLDAFKLMLEKHPEHHGKVKLVMVAVPSRTEVKTYQELRDQIEQTVSRINGTYGSVDWAPISYQFQNRPFEEVVALYNVADVALVTPIRDGMNLVAKEYIASKKKNPGVLILSEMTGAIDELPEAMSINPNDTHSVADSMHTALRMPKREQLRRLNVMQRRLKSYTVQTWADDFLHDLEAAGGKREYNQKKRLKSEQKDELVASYVAANKRLFLLDYDGTLKHFVATPSSLASKPSLKLKRMLKRLSENQNNHVAIISGRPRKTLEKWFRGIKVDIAAEHGAWTRYDGTWTKTDSDFKKIKNELLPILEKYVSRTAGSEVEEKDYSTVWHYRNVPPELAYVRATELKRELTEAITRDDIGVFSGDKIIEIKPVDINKGFISSELDALHQPDFIFCAGDDYTDEDMFNELDNDAFTIKVGSGDTKARFQVENVNAMLSLLDELSRK